MKQRIAVVCVLMICCGAILLHGNDFAYPREASFSDLTISHLPNAIYIHNAVRDFGTIPLWSNTILSGYPLIANPLSGLWYPPGWLVYLMPTALGFNLVIVLHLIAGGLGMYHWLRVRGTSIAAALLGMGLFMAMPKLAAHYAAGHISMVYAVSLTPWLLWSTVKFRNQSFSDRKMWINGVILGGMILADIRWALFAGIFWMFYDLGLGWSAHAGLMKWLTGSLKRTGATFLTSGVIAAPFLLLLFQYTRLSTRLGLTPGENMAFSLPMEKLLGILVPDFLGYAEWVLYPGAMAVLCLVYGMVVGPVRKRVWPWVLVAILCVIYALGSAVPGLSELAKIPGLNLLRVPARGLFFWGISLVVVTVEVVDWLLGSFDLPKFDPFFFLVPIITFVLLMAGGLWWFEGKPQLNFLWGAAGLLSFGALILAREKAWIPANLWFWIVLVMALVDLNGANWNSIQFRSDREVALEGKPAADYIQAQNDSETFRIYSPSYSLPQLTAARYGFELADGVDPMQLSAYVKYMEEATGVPADGYSVTLPAMANGDPGSANRYYLPDAGLLGALNVKYIVAEYELNTAGLKLLERLGTTRIYQNMQVNPRAFVEAKDHSTQPARVDWSPNRIRIVATGPGLLTLAEINSPGWQVNIDGQPAAILEGVLRQVEIGEGVHEVVFRYFPQELWFGIVITALGLAAWLVLTRQRKPAKGKG